MAASTADGGRRLRAFEEMDVRRRGAGERLFRGVLGGCLILAVGFGLAMNTMELPPLDFVRAVERRATFLIDEPEPLPEPVVEAPVEDAVDLTVMPELGRAEEAEAVAPPEPVAETTPEPETAPEPAPRRVYGVRKVFAKGLGSGGGAVRTGIVSKRGNTLDKEPDELVATEADLVGELAPLSTVSRAPQLKSRVRPEYTEEMLAARVEGLVRARLLVDVDGSVKAVEILEDIGHGSREAAAEAFRRLRFDPALRDDEPVAAWIIMKYRFTFQD